MSELTDFHFLRPWWLLAILPAAVLIITLWRNYSAGSNWQRVIDQNLLSQLADTDTSSKGKLPLILASLALALCLIALAGPSWQQLPQPVYRKQDALILLLDLSPSMYAEDVTPSRMELARREIRDILKLRQATGGLTALIVFAGGAHVVVPLTDDTLTIESLLPALHPGMMPQSGSNPLAALELAVQLLADANTDSASVMLITDGIPESDFKPLQDQIQTAQLNFGVLGIGTETGAPIPLPQGGFLKNARGDLIVAKTRHRAMQSWARQSGARYQIGNYSDADIARLLKETPISAAQNHQQLDEKRRFDQWRDAGPWLVLGILPLALLAFRRGWLLGILLLGLLPSPPGYALSWQDLWLNRDQQGSKALDKEQAEQAATLFEDPQWQGVSRYRAGDYSGAAEAFAQRDDSNAHYNRGNALARSGDLAAALEAYDRALELDPNNEDAAANKEQLEKLMQEQEQSDQNQQSSPDQGEQNKPGDSDDSQQSGDEQAGDSAENRSSGEHGGSAERPGDQGEQGEQEQTDGNERSGQEQEQEQEQDQQEGARGNAEQAEAGDEQQGEADGQAGSEADQQTDDQELQQWLRQIPDEPGDLLQRKFEYQYHRQGQRGGINTQEERY